MNALIVAAFGAYFAFVGFRGNSDKFLTLVNEDAKGFAPWAIAVGTLVILNEIPATKQMAKPFLFLMVLSFVLKNFDSMQSEFRKLTGTNAAYTGGASGSF